MKRILTLVLAAGLLLSFGEASAVKRKVIIVKEKAGGPPPMIKKRLVNLTVYAGLTGTELQVDSDFFGGTKGADAGIRGGIGISFGRLVTRHLEIEGGYTHYLNEGMVRNELDTKEYYIGSHPLYLNFLFHPRAFKWAHFYFGGGVNHSFWSMHGEDNTGKDFTYYPHGTIGYQIVMGIDRPFSRWEWGYRWMYGSYEESGETFNLTNKGFYFKGGFHII